MVFSIKRNNIFFGALLILLICGFIQFKPNIINAVNQKRNTVKIPIIMYHQITKISSRKGDYTVTLDQFKEDIEYINKKGFKTVNMTDIIHYVNGEKDLPEKPLIITFDDGFESILSYVEPIFKEKNMKGVLSIVGSYTDFFTENQDHNLTYSYIDWDGVNKLIKDNIIEIQNHSYDMHKCSGNCRKGVCKIIYEDESKYDSIVGADLEKMQNIMKEKTGYIPNTLTLPFGSYTKETISLAKKLGFKAILNCEEKINIINKGDKECLYHLGRYNRPSDIQTDKFFDRIFDLL